MTPGPPEIWDLSEDQLDLRRGVLIGVVNVTPDSFSDGGRYLRLDDAIARGHALAAEGAAVVDVGGESTRPGAAPVSVETELQRVLPVVSSLAADGVIVSIDTYKPAVAKACLEAGAQVINDVTGFVDPEMVDLAAVSGCGLIVMHMQGTPATMSHDPQYEDVVVEVERFLLGAATRLQKSGVMPGKIAIDPGFGFGKRADHSLALLAATPRLASHGFPLVLGTSRKGFLSARTHNTSPDLDLLTAVSSALGYTWGARLFRVHDVTASRQALDLAIATEEAR